ncbi:hypothetical protein JY651_44170 [Pyxidicoccus parkwayensis]|uniref:Uncharacterized protein n=1 Tax=Pyxidicoccus parkwayensis TaxID=2813578 RepID=A0ABX7NT41_9BACT|nr:hypothetical protein [Pyxidicoccus parkwaysis]QSQ22064.1 hypothetical protein JY651_44170 [Pyxidicoccus parkwaysis]
MDVCLFLAPAEGLTGVLTPERLTAFRAWFIHEWTSNVPADEQELDEDLQAVVDLVDHLLRRGAAELARPPERFQDAVVDLLDDLSDFFVRGEHAASDALARATDVSPDDKDVQAAEAVIGSACPERTQQLWRHLVWGRAPGMAVGEGIGLKRQVPSLGYWTATEVKQVRDDLREHLSGPPDYKPVRGMARFTSMLQRGLSLASRGNPSVALDAVTRAVDRAAKEGAGLLFAR